ncbi:MAG: OmpA family protein [Fibrobacterales bacterium]|nr:OmpA family protein [Fibrobacterales bacterium]
MARKKVFGALVCALCALAQSADFEAPLVPVPSIYGAAGNSRTLSAKTLGAGAMSAAVSVEGTSSSEAFGTGRVGFWRGADKIGDFGLDGYYSASYRLMLGFGVTEWLDLGANVPFHQDYITVKSHPASHRSEVNRGRNTSLGDFELWGKIQYPPYEHSHVFDLSFYGMVTFPTGATGQGLVPKAVWYVPTDPDDRPSNFTADQVTVRGMMLMTLDLLEIAGVFIPLELNANVGMLTTARSNLDNAVLVNGSMVLKPIPWFRLFAEFSSASLLQHFGERANLLRDRAFLSPGVTVQSPQGFFFTAAWDVGLADDDSRAVALDRGDDGNRIEYSFDNRYNGFSAVLGWSGYVVSPDLDGDGIPNSKDKCPLEPEDFDEFEDADGCPEPDNDGDDVPDLRDNCPNVPGPASNQGCPLPDRDGDGIPDVEDECADVFGPRANKGCPDTVRIVDTLTVTDTLTQVDTLTVDNTPAANEACPFVPVNFLNNYAGPVDSARCPLPDRDKDGVCDPWASEMGLLDHYAGVCKGKDACPSDLEDMDGFEDEDGCPDPDNDGDGFCDAWVSEQGLLGKYASVCHGVDKCPSQPETMNGFEDNDGCPDKVPKKPINLKGVEFHAGKAVLTDGAMDALMPTVESLRENPDAIIEIGGHSDNTGKRAYNIKLSQERAQSVADFLRQQGVQCEIQVKGYGPDHPIASNKTKAGQRANRRIEMKILGTKAAQPGASQGEAK